ncbi:MULTISPECIES: hypothetical protein [Virgibacillus]|uniref:Uncharacterized protein n=2 Tax=Virgibacillus TaxID=84406 RepID=A0A024QCL0_9BACI|nr:MULTISPECIES: hypothetical protein [Virgibacillus]EQB36585.1 hypothetical protein M948_16255 [Virgibacillus sp. CM-4]MYL42417.1 hypothetical protein [Virgibacillus massiliensis]GGJ42675.1 hypothetical protein GCM10007111_01010 [Virgibacillus kapii]CDQ40283.1 hypothetical protein BN990_02603 [Virgibacillus massiliensis]
MMLTGLQMDGLVQAGAEKYWYILFLVIGTWIVYRFIRSYIRWSIRRRSMTLLSYIVICLLLFSIYFGISLLNGGLNDSFYYSFPLFLQSLAIFGVILICISGIKRWLLNR